MNKLRNQSHLAVCGVAQKTEDFGLGCGFWLSLSQPFLEGLGILRENFFSLLIHMSVVMVAKRI
jgi:hypothetical protein